MSPVAVSPWQSMAESAADPISSRRLLSVLVTASWVVFLFGVLQYVYFSILYSKLTMVVRRTGGCRVGDKDPASGVAAYDGAGWVSTGNLIFCTESNILQMSNGS